jgi:hypothetical protein
MPENAIMEYLWEKSVELEPRGNETLRKKSSSTVRKGGRRYKTFAEARDWSFGESYEVLECLFDMGLHRSAYKMIEI